MARERRLAFGEVAELYDQARPSYPPELVEDVIALAPFGLTPRASFPDTARGPTSRTPRALEVGAGTGKATVLFAAHGVPVLALEPSLAMAAVAQRNCAALPDVEIRRVEFEQWEPGEATFPLLFSGQAWHWISPELRFVKARAVLQEGGVLAAFWNHPDWTASALRQELHDAYRRAAPGLSDRGPMHPADSSSSTAWFAWEDEIGRAAGLDHAEIREYRWACRYTTEDYLRLLQTHSDHIVLESGQRQALLEAVAAVLDDHGGGLEMSQVTRLCLARAA